MNTNITKGTLLALHREAQSTQGLRKIFDRGKLDKFYNDNNIKINTIITQVIDLRKTFCEMDGENIKMQTIEGKNVPVLLEGKTQEEFEEASKKLLSEETTLTT